MNKEYLRDRIKEIYRESGLNQKEFAERCELTQPTIGRILNGERGPELETLVKICVAFNLPPWFFVEEFQNNLSETDLLAGLSPTARCIVVALRTGGLSEEECKGILDTIINFKKAREEEGTK